MLSEAVIEVRMQSARAYLAAVIEPMNWSEAYLLHKNGSLPLPQAMALLLPEHYDREMLFVNASRGFREQYVGDCEANELWGYHCPLGEWNGGIVKDHLFPYALGGITDRDNLLWLCTFHNRMKGADVHVYPWERGKPKWLDATLLDIAYSRKKILE